MSPLVEIWRGGYTDLNIFFCFFPFVPRIEGALVAENWYERERERERVNFEVICRFSLIDSRINK